MYGYISLRSRGKRRMSYKAAWGEQQRRGQSERNAGSAVLKCNRQSDFDASDSPRRTRRPDKNGKSRPLHARSLLIWESRRESHVTLIRQTVSLKRNIYIYLFISRVHKQAR